MSEDVTQLGEEGALTVKQQEAAFVRLVSTPEDRAERLAFGHRSGLLRAKPDAQTRSNDRRKAIRESREDAA